MADDWHKPLQAILDEAIVIRVRHELGAHQERLLRSLGAGWVVDPRAPRCERPCGREECRVSAVAFEANWIDYRASIARVDRRLAAHEEVPTCEHCECETDVQPVPHSPRCPVVNGQPVEAGEEEDMPDSDGLAALEAMDAGQPQPHREPKETVMVECKIEGCTRDASDAPKAGPTSRLCSVHRAERSARISAERIGRPRSGRRKAATASPPPCSPTGSGPAGSPASRRERERRLEGETRPCLRASRRRAPGAARAGARRPQGSDRGASLR